METPYPYTSKLQKKASRGIDLQTLRYQERLDLYLDVVSEIRNVLYKAKLKALTVGFLDVIEEDLRLIIEDLRGIAETTEKDVIVSKEYLEKSYRKINLALTLFDEDEERDATTRIDSRLGAILDLRTNLDKAISQWPRIRTRA